MKSTRLEFVGDYIPGGFNVDLRSGGSGPWMANLEAPMGGAHLSPIPKTGPHLRNRHSPPPGIACFNLANNHMFDFGTAGVDTTLQTLGFAGIPYTGVKNLRDDERPPWTVIKAGSLSVAVIGCCESQYAWRGQSGFPLAEEGPWIFGAIEHARKDCDRVVVSHHGGLEESPWPSPSRQDACRAWIHHGADIVHGHHPHVPQGWERHGNGLILYSGGNWIANPNDWSHLHAGPVGLGFSVDLEDPIRDPTIYEYTSKVEGEVLVVTRSEPSAATRAYLQDAMAPLTERDLLAELWTIAAAASFRSAYRGILGPSATLAPEALYIHARMRIGDWIRHSRRGPEWIWSRHPAHLFRCPSHSEAIAHVLSQNLSRGRLHVSARAHSLVQRIAPQLLRKISLQVKA